MKIVCEFCHSSKKKRRKFFPLSIFNIHCLTYQCQDCRYTNLLQLLDESFLSIISSLETAVNHGDFTFV